ncbi:MAG: hypothetical protein ABSH42_03140 [Bryobacteraceae bacterium]
MLCASARAGILVIRSDHGLQFTGAVSIAVNGKDKAISLGSQPTAGAASKRSTVRLAGTLLKDSDAGVMLEFESGSADYLLPEGLPKNAPDDPAGAWKAARIVYKQSSSDKAGTEVPFAGFVAFLPAGAADLAALCRDAGALQLIGGKGKSFPTQVEFMTAAVKAYGADPAMAPLEKYVADGMRSRYEAFENGTGGVDALNQGLAFATLSQSAYPSSPEQDKLRQLLTNRKAWLDRKIAIEKAFAAAAQWDALLLGGRDLARYQQALPEIAADHQRALQGSLQLHLKLATARQSEGDYGDAYREFHLACLRKPSDSALREHVMQAWTEYSRRNAMDLQSKRTKLGAGLQSTVDRALYFADQNKREKKLDDALKSVQDAEAALRAAQPAGISTATLKVWYAEADILAAQDRVADALAALDAYDLHAVDEERAPAEALRNQLLFSLDAAMKNVKTRLQAAWSEGSFGLANQLADEGLRIEAEDTELLYYAGVSALIERSPKLSRERLTHYLEVSDTLDSNTEQRTMVSRLLTSIAAPSGPGAGDANWLSGERLPKGVFYSPASLAFQPRIDHIDGSNKFHVAFEWNGARLKSIKPSFENAARATGEKTITFGYEDHVPQVVWASDGDETRPPMPADPDEAYKRCRVLVRNSPFVDPVAVQRVTGKNLAVVIAGNPFFNPFVWEKLYYFRIAYDDSGRITRAQELSGPSGAPAEQVLEFEWSGMQLTAIRGYLGKTKNYERTMQYEDGRLVSEEIQGQAKPSHIKYNYAANRLVSAEAATDATLDNRSRKVTFLADESSALVK